jgi:hypothetical protein
MADVDVVIASHRRAVGAFVEAARAVPPSQWTTPRAPGKWSPGQVAEHVALAYEQSGRMVQGSFTGPAKPWYQQLLARWLGLPSLLKRREGLVPSAGLHSTQRVPGFLRCTPGTFGGGCERPGSDSRRGFRCSAGNCGSPGVRAPSARGSRTVSGGSHEPSSPAALHGERFT